jgi:hypothetical protein
MKTDTYTKAVLTVIALCLLWQCAFQAVAMPVSAQPIGDGQAVVITGIQIPGLDGLPVRVTGAAHYERQAPASPPGRPAGGAGTSAFLSTPIDRAKTYGHPLDFRGALDIFLMLAPAEDGAEPFKESCQFLEGSAPTHGRCQLRAPGHRERVMA